mgnify:CR=1 FL=1
MIRFETLLEKVRSYSPEADRLVESAAVHLVAEEAQVHVDRERREDEPLQAVAEVAPHDAALAEDRRGDAVDPGRDRSRYSRALSTAIAWPI